MVIGGCRESVRGGGVSCEGKLVGLALSFEMHDYFQKALTCCSSEIRLWMCSGATCDRFLN
jgi:hypothetical protein